MRISLIATLLLRATSSWAQAADSIVIRFSHVVVASTPKGYGANLLKKPVQEKLGGRVRVAVRSRARKFQDDQALVVLTLGDIELAALSYSKFRAFTEELELCNLPVAVVDADAVHRFQHGATGRALPASMLDEDIKGLAFRDNLSAYICAELPSIIGEVTEEANKIARHQDDSDRQKVLDSLKGTLKNSRCPRGAGMDCHFRAGKRMKMRALGNRAFRAPC